MLSAKGRTGTITVDDTFISIERKGAMAKMTHGFSQGEKKIPIAQVTSVQFKMPGMTVGYIQFSMAGSNESTKGVTKAMKDENTVAFERNASDFEAIRDFVEARIAERFTSSAQASGSTIAEQIRELAALRDEGLLSESEFEAEKTKLLD